MKNESSFAETEKFLRFIFPSGTVAELRAKLPDGFHSGRHDNMTTMARHGVAWQGLLGAEAVYFGLNSLKPGATHVGARDINKLSRRSRKGGAAGDKDILQRLNYLIDIDPTRPSGVCSTDAEKAASVALADRLQAYLTSCEWPHPIRVDSGNGVHLYYCGDRCNASSDEWTYVLKYLAKSFNTQDAEVDTCVHNPSRISRLPGTWNCKGPNTPDRPHRMAQVVSYPKAWVPLPHAAIVSVAHEGGFTGTPYAVVGTKTVHSGFVDDSRVRSLLRDYPDELSFSHTSRKGDLTLYILDSCPFAGYSHSGDPNKTAIILGPDSLGFKCFSDDCEGYTFKDLLVLLEEETGRKPFELTQEDFDKWEVNVLEQQAVPASNPMESYIATFKANIMDSAIWEYDKQTYDIITAPSFAACPLSTDPGEWGLPYIEVGSWFLVVAESELRRLIQSEGENSGAVEAFRKHIAGIIRSQDSPAMGGYLGLSWLLIISRHKNRPAITPAPGKPLTAVETHLLLEANSAFLCPLSGE